MGKPLVISVIAPIYGVEKYIGKFADSLLGQSYPDIQFIFVNDGTKDNSITVLKNLIAEKYSSLSGSVTIVEKQNGGLPSARMAGMQYVEGDYVYHADSDDWLAPDCISKIAEAAERTGADIIYFDFIKAYADESKVKREQDYNAADKSEYVRRMFNHRAYGCVWNKCVKRSLYDMHQTYFPQYSYGEDIYLMSQLVIRAESLYHIPEPLYYYRKDNPGAITRQKIRKRHNEFALNFMDLYEKYDGLPDDMNPLNAIGSDILMHSGWYSLMHGLNLFSRYPYLTQAIRKAPLTARCRIPLLMQLIVKIYSLFRK